LERRSPKVASRRARLKSSWASKPQRLVVQEFGTQIFNDGLRQTLRSQPSN